MTMVLAQFPDCEQRDGWLFEQDVNAWTSLAYAAVGILVLVWALRGRIDRRFVVLGVFGLLEGAGSLLYHGNRSDLGQFLHDVPLVGALGFAAGWHAGRIVARPGAAARGALVGATVGTLAGTLVWLTVPRAVNVVVVVAVATMAVGEVVARRRGRERVWNVPMLALAVFAIGVWASGTAESPLCDEASWLQPHGLWHVVTALIVLGWVDRAASADAARPPQLWRRATDRVLGLLARLLVHAFHRSVEVTGRERLPPDVPVLLVANHGNGFVDPVLVAGVLGRVPRFLAKAPLWRVVIARPFLAIAGVVPVFRSGDGDRATDNRSSFADCYRQLSLGATVAIFPEGTTGDRARLDRVRAGAARIALGALPVAPDVVVVPIGLAFESRVETRSQALVMIGAPIPVAAFARETHEGRRPARADVRALTEEIAQALEQVSPEFESVEERELLRAAARVERSGVRRRGQSSFGEVEVVARRLATAPLPARERAVDAYRRYATQLQLIGLHDRHLLDLRPSRLRLAASATALFLAGSLVVTATIIHLPAILLVMAATHAVRSPVTKGSVRLLVGLASAIATWIVAGVLISDGVGAVVAGATVAVNGWFALLIWTPLTRQAEALWGRARVRDRAGLLPPALADRDLVIDAVRAAIESTGSPAEDAQVGAGL